MSSITTEIEALGFNDADIAEFKVGDITDALGLVAFRSGIVEGTPVPKLPASHPDYDPQDRGIVLREDVDPVIRERWEYEAGRQVVSALISKKEAHA
jgi:hypothetical protein